MSVLSSCDYYSTCFCQIMMLMGFFFFQEVFHERVKTYKTWKEAEATLTKKRENKVKLEIARKMDKIPQADDEISEVQISTF